MAGRVEKVELFGKVYELYESGEIKDEEGKIVHTSNSGEYFYEDDFKQCPSKINIKRLLAEKFIPNPENYKYVMYKRRYYENNLKVSNLYWAKSNRKKFTQY